MNFKFIAFLFLALVSPTLFSACTSAASKEQEEVVITDAAKTSGDEIIINNSDLKKENAQIATSQQSSEMPKRILADKSEVETLVDGYGNKTEKRYFTGHPRLRFLVLQTAANGQREVTVYGYGGDIKVVSGLDDNALTASADEIADTSQLFKTRSEPETNNFLRGGKNQTQTQPLQPLPSSAFQKPNAQVYQPAETVQPSTSEKGVTPPE